MATVTEQVPRRKERRGYDVRFDFAQNKQVHAKAVIAGCVWGDDSNHSWTLARLRQYGPGTATVLAERLRDLAHMLKVRNLYAPIPDFSGRVSTIDEYQAIPLGDRVMLYSGPKADGIELPMDPQTACIIAIGGCGMLLATDGKKCVVQHVGLRSILRHDEPNHRSVGEQTAERFNTPAAVQTASFFSIQPHHFVHPIDDPNYAKKNIEQKAALEKYTGFAYDDRVEVDLLQLTQIDCNRSGIGTPKRTHGSYLPDDPIFAHTRLGSPRRDHRNLGVVLCNPAI